MNPIPLVQSWRGNCVETIHRGHFVVIDKNRKIIACGGDANHFTFWRSAAKPFQILPLLTSPGVEKLNLQSAEIALIVSSHYGENYQLKVLRRLLTRLKLKVTDLKCGKSFSLNPNYTLHLVRQKRRPSVLYNDCSGKHTGMLAYCRLNNFPLKNYLDPNHPLQIAIKETIARVAEIPIEQIKIGIDGCSAPVFALPIFNMALAFLKIAAPETAPYDLQKPLKIVAQAMAEAPEMLSGSGGFCSALSKVTRGRVLGKIGAEGIYCVALRREKMALAVKVEDGQLSVLPPIVLQILKDLSILSRNELNRLRKYYHLPRYNDQKIEIGFTESTFSLKV